MQLHQPVLIQHTGTGWIDGNLKKLHLCWFRRTGVRKILFKIFCNVEFDWFKTLDHTFFGFAQTEYFEIKFYLSENKKSFLSPILFLVRKLPGYLAGDRWVESWSLSYILPHRFSVRDESYRLSRSFIQGFIPKDTSIRFQREPSQSYLFTAFSMSLLSQTRASLLFFLCPNLPLHLHRSVHQKCHPLFYIVSLLRTYLTLNRKGSSHAH